MEACLFLDDGYRGGRCENSFHICESTYSPCLNGATCVHGATYLDYTCKCREGKASVFVKVSKGAAKIRNRYNQVPHLTQDTNGKVTNSQLDTTNESQEVRRFPAGDHKAHINRRSQRHSKHKK